MNRLRQRILSLVQPNKLSKTSIIRRNDLLNRLTKLLPFFRIGLIVLGFIYFLILPTNLLSREHYVSENALQPAQVNTYWNWADVHIADRNANRVEDWARNNLSSHHRADSVRDSFLALGLPAATQSYSYRVGSTDRTLNGTNAYSILRAPKTDGAEALILSASWYSRNIDSEGNREINQRGIAIVLALANYLKKYSMWSKDIIFIISDGHVEGAQAWIDSYHGFGQTNLKSERLTLTSGAIWAALNIDYSHHSFSHVGLFFEGANAHLPNLDYVNSASHILQNTGITTILGQDLSLAELRPPYYSPESWLRFIDSDFVRTYQRAARNLVQQLRTNAMGRAGGPEGVYGRYRIDAITMYAVPADGPHGFHSLGRAVESTFRSLNNLLERLHASFFLYLMTSVTTFVTVGNYLAAPIMISAGMTIHGLSLWASYTKNASGSVTIAKIFGIIGLTHAVGGAIFIVLISIDPSLPISTMIRYALLALIGFFPLLTSLLLSPSTLSPKPTSAFASVLKSFNLISAGMIIAITATLNFGAASFLALLFSLPLSSTQSRRTVLGQQLQQYVLLVINPVGIWLLMSWWNEELATNAMRNILEEWSSGGSWTLPIICLIVIPLVLQSAVVGCS